MEVVSVEQIEHDLAEAFGSFMREFFRAQEAGVDAQSVIAANLRETLGEEAWSQLPLSVKMMLG